MALIPISNILRETVRAFEKSPTSGGVGMFSYKRNRRVIITWLTPQTCLVLEDGYTKRTREIAVASLGKALRSIIKREFPRSRKIRLYKFSHEKELKTKYQKI